jgi:nicotinamide-nucleotide amidase
MRINLLLTGDELMSGDTVDSNSSMIARQLTPLGWRIQQKLTIGDDLPRLVAAMQQLSRDCDLLLINGGLGPTVDDLTAEALAAAAATPLAEHPVALEHLQLWCGERGISLNAANRKQALLPQGCEIVANPVGSAVGFSLRLNGCLVICTPGVPRELDAMLEQIILPSLRASFPVGAAHVKRFALLGIGESQLQQRISDTIPDWPDSVGLGFRAGFPFLELKLTTASADDETLLAPLLERLQPLIADSVIADVPASSTAFSLPEELIKLLTARKKHIAVAESCTGGLIAAQLTAIAGSSQVFEGGFVTYSNRMKHTVLGVQEETLQTHGAVSEPVVCEMVAGALRISRADYAVAVSGVAGPGGGSEDKPVGTVWIAWGSADNIRAVRLLIPLGRLMFQQYVAALAMDLIRRDVLGITEAPAYFRTRRSR